MAPDNQKYILSIDLGTSGSKTAIVSVYGEVVDFDFESVPLHLSPNGGAEQKPEDWWWLPPSGPERCPLIGTANP
jgi:xylulokinase